MIELGEKLNKDTRPDRKKLEILLSKQNENVAKTTNSTSIKIQKIQRLKKVVHLQILSTR